jgi:hypothetical protein
MEVGKEIVGVDFSFRRLDDDDDVCLFSPVLVPRLLLFRSRSTVISTISPMLRHYISPMLRH